MFHVMYLSTVECCVNKIVLKQILETIQKLPLTINNVHGAIYFEFVYSYLITY